MIWRRSVVWEPLYIKGKDTGMKLGQHAVEDESPFREHFEYQKYRFDDVWI